MQTIVHHTKEMRAHHYILLYAQGFSACFHLHPVIHYKIRRYCNGFSKYCRIDDIQITISDKIWVFPSMSWGERWSDIEIILVSVQGFTCVYRRVSLTRALTLTRINLNVDKVGTNSIFTVYFSELPHCLFIHMMRCEVCSFWSLSPCSRRNACLINRTINYSRWCNYT